MVGVVYYADDPGKNIFRIVYPQFDDAELNDPQWTTLGLDRTRTAVLVKCLPGDPLVTSPMTGAPFAPMTSFTSTMVAFTSGVQPVT